MKEKLESLQKQYEEKLATKEELKKKAELTELRLDRAAKLVHGLAGERVRWEESVKVCCLNLYMCSSFTPYLCPSSPPQNLEEMMGYLVGDCLVGAAFLSYAGPFLSDYRDELVQETWLKQVHIHARQPIFL